MIFLTVAVRNGIISRHDTMLITIALNFCGGSLGVVVSAVVFV